MGPADPASDWPRDRLSDGKCLKIATLAKLLQFFYSTSHHSSRKHHKVLLFDQSKPVMLVMGLIVVARAGYGRKTMRGRTGHKICRRWRWRVDVRRRSRTRVASRMRRQRVPLVLARAPGVYCIKIGLPGKLILEYTGNRLEHVAPFQDQNMY